jgi:hypothetical protein
MVDLSSTGQHRCAPLRTSIRGILGRFLRETGAENFADLAPMMQGQ